MRLLLAALALCFAQSSNPYCGKTGADFPVYLPTPICLEGQTPLPSCIEAAKNAYKNSMVAASDAACAGYNVSTATYNASVDAALDAYDACFAGAATPAERQACRATLAAALAAATAQQNSDRLGVALNYADSKSAAETAMYAALSQCCHPN